MKQPTTIVVSIGRNVGDEPMRDDRWDEFREEAIDVVCRYGVVVFSGTGTGIDPGTTIIEQSFTLVATLTTNITGLYRELAELAWAFGQESIALTTGNTAFPGSEA